MRKFLALLLTFYVAAAQAQQANPPKPLSLQECIEIALENNISMQRSNLQLQNSKISLNQSRAAFLPNLNAQGGMGRNWGRSINPVTNEFIPSQFDYANLGANTSVTVFNWFNLVNTMLQNEYLVDAARYETERVSNDVMLNVVTYYLNVILNTELYENAKFQLASSESQMKRTEVLVEAGSLAKSSLLELQSQVASDEVSLINAENNLDLATLNLKQAMLLPASENVSLVIPEFEFEQEDFVVGSVESIYETSLQVLPEIQSANANVKANEKGLQASFADFLPTISLSGSMSTNYSKLQGDNTADNLGTQFDNNLSQQLSLGINIPIFNRLSANSNYQRQKIALEQANLDVVEQQNMVRQMVETAYNDARAAYKMYLASEKQVKALEETYRMVDSQYQFGASNATDFQVASNNLFQAKSDLVRSKYDYIFKKKILDFYQGKSLNF